MIHLGEKSSLSLSQAVITRFQSQSRKCDFPFTASDDSSSSKTMPPTTMRIDHIMNNIKDTLIIQQRSKRHCSVHVLHDHPCSYHQPNSPLPPHCREEQEQHYVQHDHSHQQHGHSITQQTPTFSKKVHDKRIPANSSDYISPLSRQSKNAAKKRPWMFTRQQNTTPWSTSNQENEVVANQRHYNNKGSVEQRPKNDDALAPPHFSLAAYKGVDSLVQPSPLTHHHDHTTYRLFRRKAAVPIQLLKWAFEASMSLYDHLGDDYDDYDENPANRNEEQ